MCIYIYVFLLLLVNLLTAHFNPKAARRKQSRRLCLTICEAETWRSKRCESGVSCEMENHGIINVITVWFTQMTNDNPMECMSITFLIGD